MACGLILSVGLSVPSGFASELITVIKGESPPPPSTIINDPIYPAHSTMPSREPTIREKHPCGIMTPPPAAAVAASTTTIEVR